MAYCRVDYTNVVGDYDRGRKAIRLNSKTSYNGNHLIVIDLEHMPSSSGYLPAGCSVWPAFWYANHSIRYIRPSNSANVQDMWTGLANTWRD
jgi:hypothetical protein